MHVCKRDEVVILVAYVDLLRSTADSKTVFLDKLTNASINLKGNGKGKAGGRVGAETEAEPASQVPAATQADEVVIEIEGKGANKPWTVDAANALVRLSRQLQHKLLVDGLIPYFVEWCQTPMPRIVGVAF